MDRTVWKTNIRKGGGNQRSKGQILDRSLVRTNCPIASSSCGFGTAPSCAAPIASILQVVTNIVIATITDTIFFVAMGWLQILEGDRVAETLCRSRCLNRPPPRDLSVPSMRLLSNNPRKLVAIEGHGLSVTQWLPFLHQLRHCAI
jgi:GTP cyclohydrolase II